MSRWRSPCWLCSSTCFASTGHACQVPRHPLRPPPAPPFPDRIPSLRLHPLEVHTAVAEEIREGVRLVVALVEDASDAGVDQHFQTVNARRVRDVDVRVADAGAVLGRLGDGVDLRVDGPEAVLLELARRRARR